MGSLVIGVISGEAGAKALRPFSFDIFTGVLGFFLLDMGIVTAKKLGDLKRARPGLNGGPMFKHSEAPLQTIKDLPRKISRLASIIHGF
ncbi:MAG: sodium-dependent bicarbonate transport family permease [Pyrinomonadaceae bacterium]